MWTGMEGADLQVARLLHWNGNYTSL